MQRTLSRLQTLTCSISNTITTTHPQSRHQLTAMASTAAKPTFDALVLGSGQSGTPLATALAASGRRTALIEREHVGGCCVNEGCTPTKTMIASGRVAHLAGRREDYGVGEGGVKVQMEKVRERKRAIVRSFREGSERRLRGVEGLEVVRGEARFVGRKTVSVAWPGEEGDRELSAEEIFINVGCRPSRPGIPGLDGLAPERVLDSTSVMELDAVPEHLIVVGGGSGILTAVPATRGESHGRAAREAARSKRGRGDRGGAEQDSGG